MNGESREGLEDRGGRRGGAVVERAEMGADASGGTSGSGRGAGDDQWTTYNVNPVYHSRDSPDSKHAEGSAEERARAIGMHEYADQGNRPNLGTQRTLERRGASEAALNVGAARMGGMGGGPPATAADALRVGSRAPGLQRSQSTKNPPTADKYTRGQVLRMSVDQTNGTSPDLPVSRSPTYRQPRKSSLRQPSDLDARLRVGPSIDKVDVGSSNRSLRQPSSVSIIETPGGSNPPSRERRNSSQRMRLVEGASARGKSLMRSDTMTRLKEVKAKAEKSGLHLNPRSNFFRNWDIVVASALFFTASVTPFEVAFMETSVNVMFFLNRLVDILFVIDMIFQFLLPIQDANGETIYDNKLIAQRYIRGWFPLDVISTLPYDMISMFSDNKETSNLKVLRILRLMRLAKLLRILRAGRMFQRWEATMRVDYAKVELIKFIVVIFYLAHWLACAWHMVAVLEVDLSADGIDDFTWVNNYIHIDVGDNKLIRYCTSLYWSVATLSTLGYGDVVPATDVERLFATVCAMVGATVFAYMIGNVCSIVSGMDEHNARFYQRMDALNKFMEEKRLPDELRIRLREFFRFERKNNPSHDWKDLVEMMSPSLQEEVAEHVHSKWLSRVRCFRGCSPEFIVMVSMHLEPETYGAKEDIIRRNSKSDAMYIVDKGVLSMSNGRILGQGMSVGEDMVLRMGGFSKRKYGVRTVTNVMVNKLSVGSLQTILENFPAEKRAIRRFVVKMEFRRLYITYCTTFKRILEIEPTATHELVVEELTKCKDIEMLPYTFKHREMLSTMDHKARVDKNFDLVFAVMKIQQYSRKWIRKRRELVEKRNQKAFDHGWAKMQSLLASVGMSDYEAVLYNERVTYDMLEDLDETHLRLAGIRLGDANMIMRKYREREEVVEALQMKGQRLTNQRSGRSSGGGARRMTGGKPRGGIAKR